MYWFPTRPSTAGLVQAVQDEVAGFNGRGLADDVMDVMLTLTTNTALGDGVAPDQRRMRAEFPYFGEPYATTRQAADPKQSSEKK